MADSNSTQTTSRSSSTQTTKENLHELKKIKSGIPPEKDARQQRRHARQHQAVSHTARKKRVSSNLNSLKQCRLGSRLIKKL
jgi:hypothetical protein